MMFSLFPCAPKISMKDFFYNQEYQTRFIFAYHTATSTVQQFLDTLSIMLVLAKLLSLPAKSAYRNPAFNPRLILQKASEVVTNLKKNTVPLVNSHLEETVIKRLELSEYTVSKNLMISKSNLLSNALLQCLPCGNEQRGRSLI